MPEKTICWTAVEIVLTKTSPDQKFSVFLSLTKVCPTRYIVLF